ncbi:DUF805 domain-containing protein [uncultured Parabacteroides sp.]|uniref:DUF805 domain-containing protein n=1 Tax=uncultured Parabacteroides sp. TaxID=512312 RepID=UPI002805A6E5|nr:DUF805 domain-containing protein [uncultured Parabacteroides sp.]
MKYFIDALKKYSVHEGRASRVEFWVFFFYYMFFLIVTFVIDTLLGTTIGDSSYGVFSTLYAILTIIPSIAISVRRLHDIGKSGWYYLWNFVPYIGWLYLLILLSKKGICGYNEYGSDPSCLSILRENVLEKKDEPVLDEPVLDEPVLDEPVLDEPVLDEPVLFVKYNIPPNYIQDLPWKYPVVLCPKKNSVIRSYREGKTRLRGYKELSFENTLKRYIKDSFKILGNVHLNTSENTKPFEPDIVIIDDNLGLDIRIDIEIDEPYAAITRQACHCLGENTKRNIWFIERGWIVVRFTEKQIHTQEKSCVKFIVMLLKSIYPDFIIPLSLKNEVDVQEEDQWTNLEAQKMEKDKFREAYLGIDHFLEQKIIDSEYPFELSKKEKNEELYVIIDSFNDSLPDYSPFPINKNNKHKNDDIIKFYPEEHLYLVNNIEFIPVSTAVSRFFHEFDKEKFAKMKASQRGVTIDYILEEWECKGNMAKECGTFLHTQIENTFGGKIRENIYQFNYNGKDIKVSNCKSIEKELDFFDLFIKEHEFTPYRTEWRVFDSKYQIAGSIDLIAKKENRYIMFDWKRSEKIIIPNGIGFVIRRNSFQNGIGGLKHLDDSSYNHYCLQQNLYKYIVENNYGINIDQMFLVIFHSSYNKYYLVEVPIMQQETKYILNALNR